MTDPIIDSDIDFALQDHHPQAKFMFSSTYWLKMLRRLAGEVLRLRSENASLKRALREG